MKYYNKIFFYLLVFLICFCKCFVLNAGIVTGFTLIDSNLNIPVSEHDPIAENAIIDLSELGLTDVNIRANTSGVITRVNFSLTGAENRIHSESVSPYALFVDSSGDYENWTPIGGDYTLSANDNGGENATINFTVIAGGDSDPPPPPPPPPPSTDGTIQIIVQPQSSISSNNRAAYFNWQFESESGAAPIIGQYACGNYWVAPAQGDSDIRLLALTGSGIAGQTDLLSLDSDPKPTSHGLIGFGKTYGSYNPSENDQPNLPILYTPPTDSAISLVASMQRNEAETSAAGTKAIVGGAVDAYCFVTLLPAPPPDNGINSIRPNIVGDKKEFLTWDDFDLTKLPSHDFIGSHQNYLLNSQIRWNYSTEVFAMSVFDGNKYSSYSEGGRAFRAHILHHNYAAGWSREMNNTLMQLMGTDTIETKKRVLASVLAHGLDSWHLRYGINDCPAAWSSGAGQRGGQFNTPAFLAALLKNPSKAIRMRRTIVENYTDPSFDLRGPQEMRQVMRGQTGVPLWGDYHDPIAEKSSELTFELHRRYWSDLFSAGCFEGSVKNCDNSVGKRTASDPHGYIDGPPGTPGSAYFTTTAAGIRAFAALMILFPEFGEIANSREVIEYADRVSRFGIWSLPDPVAAPIEAAQLNSDCGVWSNPGGCDGYRTIWGPTLEDRRYAIENGVGRFSSIHGTDIKILYGSLLVEQNWNEIISRYNGPTFEDTITPIGTVVAPDIYFFNDDTGDAFVFLRCSTFDSVIHYEIGNSSASTVAPSSNSPVFTDPIPVSLGQVIKTYAVKDGLESSETSVKQLSWSPGTVLSDETPPLIYDIEVFNVTPSSAVIRWTSNESATSGLDYGLSATYGETFLDNALSTSHSVEITGLNANTTYHFRVQSTDSSGNLTLSDDFTFNTLMLDATPPDVVITDPVEGSTLSGLVTILADATDNKSISKVVFRVNSVELKVDTTIPYTFSWDTASEINGSHSITAIAEDNSGNTNSFVVNVTVENILNSSDLPPSLFMDENDLNRVKATMNNPDSTFYDNYQLLLARADSAVGVVPDPFSMADVSQIEFGWCRSASLPDDSLKDLTTKLEIQSDTGRTLALAWLLTGDQNYADGAVEMLRAWASDSTLLNMYDFNINFNNATFDGMTTDGFCSERPWNMALDGMWQTYGLINFADSYIILKSNGYPFSTADETLIRNFILELTEAVNSSFHAWTRWADAHPTSSGFERYRSDNHLSWCLAGLIAGAVALEDEALAGYVLNGESWVDSKAGNYANPSSIRSVIDYAIESGTGQENEGRIYEEKILRNPPIGYSLFHLWPMALVATVAEKHFADDVWNFKGTDGGGMLEAYERYSAYILGERSSPEPEQENNLTDYRWLYEFSYAQWQTEQFENVLSIGTRNKHIVQSIGTVNLLIGQDIELENAMKPTSPTNFRIISNP